MLCVVDDAHWLDPATTDAVLVGARRLGADRVLLLLPPETRPRRRSNATASRKRPDRAPPGRRPGRTWPTPRHGARARGRRWDRSATGGNPLVTSLPTEPARRQGSAPDQLHLSTRVERAFLDRSRLLPSPAQSLLLLAADDTGCGFDVLRGAAATLGLAEETLSPSWPPAFCSWTKARCRWRHPLVRRAVYQAATGDQHRRAHRALADALATSGTPTGRRQRAAAARRRGRRRPQGLAEGWRASVAAHTPRHWAPTTAPRR